MIANSQIEIEVISSNPGLREVCATSLQGELSALPGCSLISTDGLRDGMRARLTGLEVVVAIATSTAATYVARAIYEAIRGRNVSIKLTKANGETLEVSGSGLVPIEKLIDFVANRDGIAPSVGS